MNEFQVHYMECAEVRPYWCVADDADHAREQCENAEPGREIVYVEKLGKAAMHSMGLA